MRFLNAKRLFKWLILIFLSLITSIIGLSSWIYQTESGLQWVVKQTTAYLPTELNLADIQGNLSEHVSIKQAQWHQNEQQFQADNLILDCQWIDLIFKQVNCKQIDIEKITIIDNQSQAINDSTTNLPDLPVINLPINIQLQTLTINQVELIKITENNNLTIKNQLYKINLKQFSYSLSIFNWKQLSFDFNEHNLQVAGNFKPDNLWQHQVNLKVSGPMIDFVLLSNGSINQKSQIKFSASSPLQIEANGNWFWKNGLFLDNTKIIADKQTISYLEQKIELDRLQSELSLNWPQLITDTDILMSWQEYKNISFKIKSNINNLLNWQSMSSIELLAKGYLNQKLLKESIENLTETSQKEIESLAAVSIQPNQLNAKQLNVKQLQPNDLPLNISLQASIIDNLLQINTDEIKLADISADIDGKILLSEFGAGSRFDYNYDSMEFESTLKAKNLDFLLGFPIKKIETQSKIQYLNNHWSITTQGKTESITHPSIAAKNIEWNINLNDIWRGYVKAESINLIDTTLLNPKLDLVGNQNKHQLNLTSDVSLQAFDNYLADRSIKNKINQFNLNLSGRLDSTKKTTDWQINQLKAIIPFNNLDFKLEANQINLSSSEQSIKNLCIQTTLQESNIPIGNQINTKLNTPADNGEICISGKHNNNQLTSKINLKKLALSPLFDASKMFHQLDNLKINGNIDGTIQLETFHNKFNNIIVNFNLPELIISDLYSQTQWSNLSFKSNNNNNTVKLDIDWLEQLTMINNGNWQSLIKTPEGNLHLELAAAPFFENTTTYKKAETLDFQFNYLQQKINLQLPHAIKSTTRKNIQVEQINLQGHIKNNRINSELNLQLVDKDHLVAKLQSNWPMVATSSINGEWDLLISQLDWLKEWQPNIDNLDLQLQQTATFKGTFAKPQINGVGKIQVNHLTIDEIGLDITDSYINLISENENILLNSTLKNQAGELNINGKTILFPMLSSNLKVTGNQLTLIDNDEQQVIISPDLIIDYYNDELLINGKLTLDKAKIKISSLPQQAIKVSDDQKIIGIPTSKEVSTKYKIQLALLTGKDVYIEGFGLSSKIDGQLNANLQNRKPISLNGRLNLVNGKFEAYKQKLSIDEGQLLFLGPVDNPGIQFKATRKIDEIQVGIVADGSLNNPRLTLYSIPAMPEENILALLLTGRTIESLTQSEGNALANAAIGLGVDGANMLAQKIGSALGIKNMAITSKSKANSTRVDIGAQINDRLTVGYGTSIDSTNQMQAGWVIEYQLSPSISFEATSGEEVSASINFKKQISSFSDDKKD